MKIEIVIRKPYKSITRYGNNASEFKKKITIQ